MNEITKTTANWTALDTMNSEISMSLKDCDGMEIPVLSIALGKEYIERFNGDQTIVTLKDIDGNYYSTISATAVRTLE